MIKVIQIWLLICVISPSFSQALARTIPEPSPRTLLEFPLLDLPFNFAGPSMSFPSMNQSLALSKNFYQSAHYALMSTAGKNHRWLGGLAIAGFDYLSTYLPFGYAWLHEEWHRATLSRRNISSFNDVYNFPIFQSSIAVSHLSDNDLIFLKREHPAEQVRLQSAGWEAELELNASLQKDSFFNAQPGYHLPLMWINTLGTIGYLFVCASDSADSETDSQNIKDGSNISKRDFTGLDCTGWTYDLFRPDEPYQARGTHPSGVGINRYRKYSDLTREEQNYLRNQAWFSLINILNPALIGISPDKWNLFMRHLPTSFGSSTELYFYLKQDFGNLILALHSYFNQKQYYPGIEAELIHFPYSLRSLLWLQPKNQRFDAGASSPGALLSLKYHYPVSPLWELYAELEGKTEGWVAGNVYLNKMISFRLGLSTSFF